MSADDYQWWLAWKETANKHDRLVQFAEAAEQLAIPTDLIAVAGKDKPPVWLKSYYYTAAGKVNGHPKAILSPGFMAAWMGYLVWRKAYGHKMLKNEVGCRQTIGVTLNHYKGDMLAVSNAILHGMMHGWIKIPPVDWVLSTTPDKKFPQYIRKDGTAGSPRSDDARWLQEAETVILKVHREFQLPPQYSAADELFELAMSSDKIKLAQALRKYDEATR